MGTGDTDAEDLERFWADARVRGRLTGMAAYFGPTVLASVVPPTFAFSDEHAEADRVLAQVLDGTRTASSTPRAAYDAAGADLPTRGDLAIAVDGHGHPRALIATAEVRTVAARGADQPGLLDDALVVLEAFVVLHPATRSGATFAAMFGRG